MYQPLVSIVTIVYNGEQYLEQTIQSVLQQSYPNIEYIIIDGGSKDGSVNIIKKYENKLAYWVSEKDKGVSDAFNKGIAKANGEIIGLINADDWYEINTLEKVVSVMNKFDIAYGDLRLWKNEKPEAIFQGEYSYLHNEMTLNHPTVFIKKAIYQQHGLFDLNYKYAMDYDLLLRLKLKGCSFVRVPDVLANMRWEGISDRQWFGACKEVAIIKDKYMPHKKFSNKLYFFKQITVIAVGKFLQQIHLGRIVRFYRSTLSPVKKRY
ncbi:MAG: glycosyltransferase family 2 protein [Flavisolibacter sp.]|jgi:glycosyltransferase involved in cell wall biosynthesis